MFPKRVKVFKSDLRKNILCYLRSIKKHNTSSEKSFNVYNRSRVSRILTTICDIPRSVGEYKIKMALLGPEESFKSAFRNKISTGNLSDHNKAIIGVTIGGLKVETTHISSLALANVYVSMWDIDCSTRFSMFRTQYYRGSEAIIVILDENTLEQVKPYYNEILQHNPAISLCIIVLHDGDRAAEIDYELNEPELRQFERVHIHQPQEALQWILEKFYLKINQNIKQDSFGILFLPKAALFGTNPLVLHYVEYACPIEHFDELNPHVRLNSAGLAHFVEKLGFPVDGLSTIISNKFGDFTVSLREGNIQYTPRRCLRCKQRCTQNEPICIVASSKGFSSIPGMTQAELIVVAKILALQDGDLPDHVLKQMSRIDKCPARSSL